MQGKRGTFDQNSPEVRAFLREVREATFTKEGMMVAFPPCFPGMTVPIVPDESRITALDVASDGVIYGGTTGYRSHLFVAGFHGLGGIVFDLGVVPSASRCVAVCCGDTRFVAFVNGAGGGRAILVPAVDLFKDLVQEWHFARPAFDDLGECVAGEPIVHAVAAPSGSIVATTTRRVFTLDVKSRKFEVVGEAPARGRLAVTASGNVVGHDGESGLWRFNPRTSQFRRGAIRLPARWTHPLFWARDTVSKALFTADDTGRLYSFDEDRGFSGPLAQTPLAPVGPMAVTFDGRVFGFCGTEMARLFCFDPATGKVTNLGGAASVIERRRYGYVFGDAVTGRDGEIVFGEDDNGGHLWLYFPRIISRT
ncbi:MAG: hypothetical protein ACM3NQ_11545 [Bacteroidales bacterium]